jgi:hypothetical protein
MPELPCDCNTLSFELSGDGEIALSLLTKAPGPTMALAAAPPSCRSVHLRPLGGSRPAPGSFTT